MSTACARASTRCRPCSRPLVASPARGCAARRECFGSSKGSTRHSWASGDTHTYESAAIQGEHVVKIRLKRMGTTKRPVYRLVVADSRSPRDGRFIEAIGFYDPLPNPAVVRIDVDRVKLWIQRGARPSDTARDLLVREGVLTAPPRPAREPVSSGAGSVVADGSAG